jgi:hypothetical protein
MCLSRRPIYGWQYSAKVTCTSTSFIKLGALTIGVYVCNCYVLLMHCSLYQYEVPSD